jgi:hypothetical protein
LKINIGDDKQIEALTLRVKVSEVSKEAKAALESIF